MAIRVSVRRPQSPLEHRFREWRFLNFLIALFALQVMLGCSREIPEEDLEHFRASVDYLQQSFTMEEQSRQGSVEGSMSPESWESIVRLRKLALEEAEKLNPDSLTYFDKDMPDHFRNEYLAGLRMWLDGEEGDDIALMNRGTLSVHKWGDYYLEWQSSSN